MASELKMELKYSAPIRFNAINVWDNTVRIEDYLRGLEHAGAIKSYDPLGVEGPPNLILHFKFELLDESKKETIDNALRGHYKATPE